MRIAAISDLHGELPSIPPCDLLLIAGDLCPCRRSTHLEDFERCFGGAPLSLHDPLYQAHWLHEVFRAWLESLPAKHIVGIAGNHDFVFETMPRVVPSLPWTYLQDSGAEVAGLKVYGSPWQPRFMDWAFNADGQELKKRWAAIPDDTEILMTHGPPFGVCDLTEDGRHAGCLHLMERVSTLAISGRLKLHVFGHIHEGGQWAATRLGGAIVANVSHLDERYRPVHAPRVFDL